MGSDKHSTAKAHIFRTSIKLCVPVICAQYQISNPVPWWAGRQENHWQAKVTDMSSISATSFIFQFQQCNLSSKNSSLIVIAVAKNVQFFVLCKSRKLYCFISKAICVKRQDSRRSFFLLVYLSKTMNQSFKHTIMLQSSMNRLFMQLFANVLPEYFFFQKGHFIRIKPLLKMSILMKFS